jgi:hypothetical protein
VSTLMRMIGILCNAMVCPTVNRRGVARLSHVNAFGPSHTTKEKTDGPPKLHSEPNAVAAVLRYRTHSAASQEKNV